MKKLIAIVLSVILMLSVLPISVFATTRDVEFTEHYIKDTFVYEFERGKDKKFTTVNVTIVHVYSDGSTWEESRTAYSNTSVGIYDGILCFTDTQDETPWVAGNTYQVESNFGTFSVEVKETPIVSVEFDDVICCSLDENGKYFYMPIWTVMFDDGSFQTWNYKNVEWWHGGCNYEFPIKYTDTQDIEPWVTGETYQVTATVDGVSNTFNVTANTIADITIDDVIRYEGTGYKDGHWDSETDSYIENSWVCYGIYPQNVTVTFSDGSVISGDSGEISGALGQYYSPYTSNQSYENQWGVGTHTAIMQCLGVEKEYNVIIKPCPIESIDIQDISIMEYSGGYDYGDFYYYYVNNIKAKVTFNDDTVVDYDGGIDIEGGWYNININTEIQYDEHWTVGNTYEVVGSLMGVEDTFNVTIMPSPVKSIEIQDLSIIEHTKGSDYGDYYYYYVDNIKAKVTFNDDTVVDYNGWIDIEGEGYNIDVNTEIQYDEPWLAGNTYEVVGSLMGVEDTFNVTITPTPVKSIEIEDLSIIEGGNCRIENGNYFYDIYCHNTEAKITFTDGTVINDYYFNYGDDQYHIEIDTSSQYEAPWVAGNTYQVTATLLGASCTFNVTILPSPIKSIKFKDIVLRQGVDSYFDGEQDFYDIPYEFDEIIVNDGETFEINEYGDFIYNDEYYYPSFNASDMQWQEPWQVGGTYEVTGTLLGVSSTFNVTIVENPIESIELVKAPDKTEYLQGEDLNLKGLHIRINYKDGTYEDIIIKDNYTGHYPYERYFYSKKLDKGTSIYANFESSDIAIVYVFDDQFEIPITTKENLAEQITLKENADKSLTITVYNSDATSYDMKVLSLGYAWGADDGVNEVSFHTDKGEYKGRVIIENNTLAVELCIGEYDYENPDTGFIRSNKIPKSDWFEIALRYTNNMSPLYWLIDDGDNYSGTITENNIDYIIELALWLTNAVYDDDKIIDETDDYIVFSGDTVKDAVLEWFALEDVDLTLSQHYDEKANIYKNYPTMWGGGEILKYGPDTINYNNGVWTVITSSSLYDESAKLEIKLTIDDDYKIITFDGTVVNMDYIPGDTNGDGSIDNKDYALLMQYLNGWSVTINLSVADTNVDGSVDNKDYALLMQYLNDWDVTLGPKN